MRARAGAQPLRAAEARGGASGPHSQETLEEIPARTSRWRSCSISELSFDRRGPALEFYTSLCREAA